MQDCTVSWLQSFAIANKARVRSSHVRRYRGLSKMLKEKQHGLPIKKLWVNGSVLYELLWW